MDQKLWPAHCVQESWGSEFHKDLIVSNLLSFLKNIFLISYQFMPKNCQIHPQSEVIHKGINPEVDSYSAFFDNAKLGKTKMDEILRAAGVTDVYVCGIATDVCVGNRQFYLTQYLGISAQAFTGHARTPDKTNKHIAPQIQ